MSEIRVIAVITAAPESVGEVRSALETLVGETKKEEGCVAYELFMSAADPSAFVTVETWRSQADIDAHFASPHIAAAMAATDGRLAVPLAVHPLVPLA